VEVKLKGLLGAADEVKLNGLFADWLGVMVGGKLWLTEGCELPNEKPLLAGAVGANIFVDWFCCAKRLGVSKVALC
jgi:hypothetical protein